MRRTHKVKSNSNQIASGLCAASMLSHLTSIAHQDAKRLAAKKKINAQTKAWRHKQKQG